MDSANGKLVVCEEQRVVLQQVCVANLRGSWPDSSEEDIEWAASIMQPALVSAGESLVVDFRAAETIGREIAARLGE